MRRLKLFILILLTSFCGAGSNNREIRSAKGRHADRLAPQGGVYLLLDACKEAVKVQIKPFYGLGFSQV